MLPYHNSSMMRLRQTEKSLINNVNVIDLRALSPGMRHLTGNQPYRKASDNTNNFASSNRKSPINESSSARYLISKTNDSCRKQGPAWVCVTKDKHFEKLLTLNKRACINIQLLMSRFVLRRRRNEYPF